MTGVTWSGAAAVMTGAAMGALLRWLLTVGLGSFSGLTAGTLVANALGCFVAGILVGVLSTFPVSDVWRLFFVTGFLGGLTTFSTFSTESVGFLMAGAWERWVKHLAFHVVGGLVAASLGVLVTRFFLR